MSCGYLRLHAGKMRGRVARRARAKTLARAAVWQPLAPDPRNADPQPKDTASLQCQNYPLNKFIQYCKQAHIPSLKIKLFKLL